MVAISQLVALLVILSQLETRSPTPLNAGADDAVSSRRAACILPSLSSTHFHSQPFLRLVVQEIAAASKARSVFFS